MQGCSHKLHRTKLPRECARDSIADVDPLQIKVRIDKRSDLPLEHWQDQLKRQRRHTPPQSESPESPAAPGRLPPDGLIDEYAAPRC